jgi:hypothetical protein
MRSITSRLGGMCVEGEIRHYFLRKNLHLAPKKDGAHVQIAVMVRLRDEIDFLSDWRSVKFFQERIGICNAEEKRHEADD